MNHIRFATLADTTEVKKIMDEGISQDYYSIQEIESYINNENNYLLVSVSDEDKPLAAMFCSKGTLKEMCELEHIPYPDSIFDKYSEDAQAVVYKTASTYKAERCNGHVKDLFYEYDKMFNDIAHELRIGLAIVLPDGTVPIKSHVDKYGFKAKKLIKSPWSYLKSYCSYCKNEYCQCDGMIYIKEI